MRHSVGLVDGLGPESTIDYYRRILELWAQAHPSTTPPIVIDSLDSQVALRLVATDRLALIEYLLESLRTAARFRRLALRSLDVPLGSTIRGAGVRPPIPRCSRAMESVS